MKMPMRLVKEVPEIYVDQSRDMQLLLRLMDCVYGGVKFDIDSVLNLTRTDQCKSNYLQLLQSKVGFLSDKKFDLEDLRLALSAFPWLVKNKGSKKAIKQAVNAYLKMRHIKADFDVKIKRQYINIIDNDFLKVDYIESSGTQYIDSGIKLKQNYGFDIKFLTNSKVTGSSGFGCIFGGRTSSGTKDYQLTTFVDKANYGGTLRWNSATTAQPKIEKNVVQTCSLRNNVFTNTKGTTYNITSGSEEAEYNAYIFGLNNANTFVQSGSGCRIYSLKFYDENDDLIRDFVPCVRIIDRKPGLYDTCTKTFFVNAGSSEFDFSGLDYSTKQLYTVQIGIEGNIGDTTILDEIFKYILPTGYEVEYVQYKQPETNAVELAYNDSIDYIIPLSGQNQTVGYTNENLLTYYGGPRGIHSGTAYGITFELKGDNRFIANGTTTGGGTIFLFYGNSWNPRDPALNIQTLPAGVYTLSVKGRLSGGVLSGWNYTKNEYLFQNFTPDSSKTFELSEETSIAIARNSGGVNLVFNDDFYIKLEKGDTATPYSAPDKKISLMQSVGTQNLLEKES